VVGVERIHLARVFDDTKYPTAARVGTAPGTAYRGAYSPVRANEFGLLGVLIAERGKRL